MNDKFFSNPFVIRWKDKLNRLRKVVTLEEEVCEHCGGTGEVSVTESVYPGEPHMAMVGTRTCECSIREEEPEE